MKTKTKSKKRREKTRQAAQLPQVTVKTENVEAVVAVAQEIVAETPEAVEPQVTHLEPGEGIEQSPAWKPKVEITYECEGCGTQFISHRARQGEKLCAECAGLRRALKGFLKRGINEAEILRRSKILLS